MYSRLILCGWCLCGVLFLSTSVVADLLARVQREIRRQPGLEIGISMVDAETGRELFGFNASRPLIPASVMKLVTTAVALDRLGPDFRFETGFFADNIRGEKVPHLYVKGGGDPDLTTEKLWVVVQLLRRRGITSVGKLVLDTSRFVRERPRQGIRAYQSGTSALAINHNTLSLEICPTLLGQTARVSVDPVYAATHFSGSVLTVKGGNGAVKIEEIPLQAGQGFVASFKLSGAIGVAQACDVIYRSIQDPRRYFVQVFTGLLRDGGIQAPVEVAYEEVPPGAKTLWVHRSKALSLILEDLNHYSNNFIAEQMVTTLGGWPHGQGDHRRGVEVLALYLRKFGYPLGEFTIRDGSGLDRGNRLSARIITRLLVAMEQNKEFHPEFEKSLSVAGRNGTLKRREISAYGLHLRGKTGTLDGVSALAGYFYNRVGAKIAFAIIQNHTGSREYAHALEDRIIEDFYSGGR